MMIRRISVRIFIVSLLLVIIPTSSVLAQQQNSENAQKFIAQIANLGQMTYAWRNLKSIHPSFERAFYTDESEDPEKTVWYDIEIGPVKDVISETACRTEFKAKETTAARWLENSPIVTTEEAKLIMWRSIVAVDVEGSNVLVTEAPHSQYGQVIHRFGLPSPQLATRMAYAMTVLRVTCDATGGTGF